MTKQIFISYARADGEEFAKTLHRELISEGYSVWWDREAMESRGQAFLQVIRDAITVVDRLLLVVTPGAVESPYVKAEWEYARSICKVITPILRVGDYKLVPEEINHIHCMDFRVERDPYSAKEELLRLVQGKDAKPARLFVVPELPSHFLPRPADLNAVRSKLLADLEQPTVLSGKTGSAGIQGMGGIGKSVLAAAVARDCSIRQAFSDGIYWLSIGQNPRLPSLQAQLGEMLGDNPRQFIDIEDGKRRLSTLLQDKQCLVILDDVWTSEPLSAFNVFSGRNRLLVTTRNIEPMRAFGVGEYRLDLLSEADALKLLSEWTKLPIEEMPNEAREIIRECGRLPLAISMIGAMLQGRPHNRWEAVLTRLKNADIDKIRQDFPDYPYPDLLKAIEVSVESLDGSAREHYFDFAVFPEDTAIPEKVLETFWTAEGMDSLEIEEIIDQLVDRSLLRRDNENRLSLHDLQVDYVQKRNPNLTSAHERLLNAYKPEGQEWWEVEGDGYIHYHLAHHLHILGQEDMLEKLLTASDEWLKAKFKHCLGDSAYVDDLRLALHRYKEMEEIENLIPVVRLTSALQVVNARVSSYTDDMLETMVWLDRKDEAISHAALRTTATSKVQSLLKIFVSDYERYQNLNRTVLQLIKNTIEAIGTVNDKSSALCNLTQALTKSKAFVEAERIALSLEDNPEKATALRDLAQALVHSDEAHAKDVFAEVERITHSLKDNSEKTFALRDLVQTLTKSKVFMEAERVALSLKDNSEKASALGNLARALVDSDEAHAKEVFAEAERIALSIEDNLEKLTALRDLAQALVHSDEAHAKDVFREAERIALSIEDNSEKASALHHLAQALVDSDEAHAKDVFREAERIALSIEDNSEKASSLHHLAQALAESKAFVEAERIALSIEHSFFKTFTLNNLTQALAESKAFVDAERIALSIEHSSLKASALHHLAQALTKSKAFVEAERIILSLKDNSEKASALSDLARALIDSDETHAKEVFAEAERIALSIEDNSEKASALRDFARVLVANNEAQAKEVFAEAERIALNIEDNLEKLTALRDLAQALVHSDEAHAKDVFAEAESIALSIEDNSEKTFALRDFAQVLTKSKAFVEAERIALSIEDNSEKASALSDLARALIDSDEAHAKDVFREAERIALSIEDNSGKASALGNLARALVDSDEAHAKDVFREAERIALSIEDNLEKSFALGNLARTLVDSDEAHAKDVFREAERIALNIEDNSGKAPALGHLARALVDSDEAHAKDVFREAERIALNIEDNLYKDYTLSNLAQALTKIKVFVEAERIALSIENSFYKASALHDLAQALAESKAFVEAERIALSIENSSKKASALHDLALALLTSKHYVKATNSLGMQASESYLSFLFEMCQPMLEDGLADFWMEIMIEALRIVSWVRPSWGKVAEILKSTPQEPT